MSKEKKAINIPSANYRPVISDTVKAKQKKLEQLLKSMGKVAIAFSGGTDSTYLLKTAAEILPGKVLAITAKTPLQTQEEITICCNFTAEIAVPHILMTDYNPLNDPDFVINPPDRCYYCKKKMYNSFLAAARQQGYSFLAEGSNADDDWDYRPGAKAIKELNICSPLKEADLNKYEIRYLAQIKQLTVWNRPSSACLASRIPYGESINEEMLLSIEKAELFLKKNAFSDVRVRVHNFIARIEIPLAQIPLLLEPPLREQIIRRFKDLGFIYISVDLEGLRSGSMNDVLSVASPEWPA